MRFLGTDGHAKLGLAPQNTVHQLKRILGKKFNDPQVRHSLARLEYWGRLGKSRQVHGGQRISRAGLTGAVAALSSGGAS